MIVGFRYGLFGPTTAGSYSAKQRPASDEHYYGEDYFTTATEYNYVTNLQEEVHAKSYAAFTEMDTAPSQGAHTQTSSWWRPIWDDVDNKYEQWRFQSTDATPGDGEGDVYIQNEPYEAFTALELSNIENLLDPQNELTQITSGALLGSATIPANNVWAVDFIISTVDPSCDLWYGQPDLGKFGWVTPVHVNADLPYFGVLQFINFTNTRIFFRDR